MSPKLKPLLLPQLVEERRMLEVQQTMVPDVDPSHVYSADNTSSSDIASPVTPTFSQRSGHMRYSSSSSSLELMPPAPLCTDNPVSPTQLAYTSKSVKTQLPDVQEDPAEREEEEHTLVRSEIGALDYCLCDEPCSHSESSTFDNPGVFDYDYDTGFLSDSDFSTSSRSKRRRHVAADSLSGITSQITSRIPGLSRLRSNSKRSNITFTPASDPSLDLRPTLSRAASSRSSSISAPVRHVPDRCFEPPLPPTPALSYYGSTESIVMPPAQDIDFVSVQQSLERERAMATTPLLPPLLTSLPSSSQPQSVAQSPLQSPTIAPSPSTVDPMASQVFSLPPLSTKPSLSSFRPVISPSASAPPTIASSELPSPLPPTFDLLEQNDAWSDRLGHANYTINPKPYQPDTASLRALQDYRSDWDQARVNYTKHLARTGEHYGSTSKTFHLTEAKWAETEEHWKVEHDILVDRIVATGDYDALPQQEWSRLQGEVPSIIPRMLDAKGKFPELGDQEIVGPMVRDAVMVRDQLTADERQSTSKFWKSLAGKVGLRK
ncbi:uncharacterized protein E0L32_011538 [Thyridium curvatum]|uniref:Only prolin and serin are matching in the corresponding protein n=1 Tax=Thyridium curvatum TaxID=1093900 RepID=A0A507BMR0_9PEZI|nr:uncharacterized protein E0L32_011538 [Thyridium curvatum]TPX18789.1 hypothetical protein E0L32_011538 [Thyridium curvatum]